MTAEYAYDKRRKELRDLFGREFSRSPAYLFSSPGRAEIVGNHTDHNCGKVLVGAISCDILAYVSPREDGIVEICSGAFSPIRFSVRDLVGREREKGRSIALARGTLAALSGKGYPVGGFSAATHSTVFRGAGVSSSAAFELLVAEIENVLYLEGKLSPLEKAAAAQYAENVYFGKPCGLLDQCGIALGGLNKIDFASPSRPLVAHAPSPEGYSIVLTNTGGSHAGLTSHYADIPREMGEVAAALSVRVLRESSLEALLDALPLLRTRTSDRAILRAIHFFEENERVETAFKALREGNLPLFLDKVRESGESSVAYLQNAYVPASLSQPLVLAHKLSEKLIKDGAFRLMGGGFTGTLLAFCKNGSEEEYAAKMAHVFGRENVFFTRIRERGTTQIEESGNKE